MTTQNDLAALTERISLLEKRLKRIRRVTFTVIVCCVSLTLVAAGLALPGYDGKYFLINDANGNIKGGITQMQNQGAVFYSAKSMNMDTNIWLGSSLNNGEPILEIVDSQGNKRVFLGVGHNGKTQLRLYDRSGRLYWSAPSK